MKKNYNIAGVQVCVIGREEELDIENGILKPFLSEEMEGEFNFRFRLVENLSKPEGKCVYKESSHQVYQKDQVSQRYIGGVEQDIEGAYIKLTMCGNETDVEVLRRQVLGKITTKVVLNSLAAEHLVLEADGVILHASFIEHNGQSILFTAPSGTGKSTQAELWAKHRGADIINGDRAVSRLIDGKPYACGIPFAGSSKHCKNATLPLAAIVYLGQAKETTINRLDFKSAFKHVWEGCTVNTWNPDDLNKAIDIVQQITFQVPVYHLQCTPDESAVTALETELEKL